MGENSVSPPRSSAPPGGEPTDTSWLLVTLGRHVKGYFQQHLCCSAVLEAVLLEVISPPASVPSEWEEHRWLPGAVQLRGDQPKFPPVRAVGCGASPAAAREQRGGEI